MELEVEINWPVEELALVSGLRWDPLKVKRTASTKVTTVVMGQDTGALIIHTMGVGVGGLWRAGHWSSVASGSIVNCWRENPWAHLWGNPSHLRQDGNTDKGLVLNSSSAKLSRNHAGKEIRTSLYVFGNFPHTSEIAEEQTLPGARDELPTSTVASVWLHVDLVWGANWNHPLHKEQLLFRSTQSKPDVNLEQ